MPAQRGFQRVSIDKALRNELALDLTKFKPNHMQCAVVLTYLPHKAVAEVSKDKEPIGRACAEFNWFESELKIQKQNKLRDFLQK